MDLRVPIPQGERPAQDGCVDGSDLWQWLNLNGAGLGAAATVMTALVAIYALRQAAIDSRERSRPVVLAEFRRAENSHSTIDLVIRNAGLSVARDVQVTFDPKPAMPADASGLLTPYLLKRYAAAIPTLSPGQELSNIWFSGQVPPGGGPEMVNQEPTSDEVTVLIAYRGTGRRVYRESFPLHVDVVRMMTYSTSSDSVPGRIDGIYKSLQSLDQSVKRLAKAADYLRRDEIEAEKEWRREQMEQLRAREVERQAALDAETTGGA